MTDIHNIYDVIGEMKRKPRTGWVDHEIPNPETVWQHSRSMRAVCYELATRYLGPQHAKPCAALGAIHDIIEGVVALSLLVHCVIFQRPARLSLNAISQKA